MPDLKPPRLTGDERETLHALLQYHRESLVRKVDGIDETARHAGHADILRELIDGQTGR